MKRYLACLVCLAAGVTVPAQRNVPVGLDIGIFLPSNSEVRDIFGDTWIRVGLTPLSFQAPDRWKFTFDFGYLHRSPQNIEVTLIPLTFGVTRSFGRTDSEMRPYVALRAGPYWGDVKSSLLGIDEQKFGFDANASVGVSFKQSFYIEARYDWFSELGGFDFNGLSFSVGFKLFDLRL